LFKKCESNISHCVDDVKLTNCELCNADFCTDTKDSTVGSMSINRICSIVEGINTVQSRSEIVPELRDIIRNNVTVEPVEMYITYKNPQPCNLSVKELLHDADKLSQKYSLPREDYTNWSLTDQLGSDFEGVIATVSEEQNETSDLGGTHNSPLEDTAAFFMNATDDELLQKFQRDDPYLRDWFKFLEHQILPRNERLANEMEKSADLYYIDQQRGILCCYRSNKNNKTKEINELDSVILVPRALQFKLLNAVHSLGHPGVAKMFESLRTKYLWPGMHLQIVFRFARVV